MSNLTDLSNTNNLDESFSSASGCGLPPVGVPTKVITGTRRECKKVFGKEICINVPTVKTVPNDEFIAKAKKYKECVDQKVKDTAAAAKKDIDKAAEKAKKDIKDAGKNIVTTAKTAGKNIATTTKKIGGKVKKGLKNLVGKVRAAYKKLLRKQILSAIFLTIRANAHGIATKLYPAIASDAQLKQGKFKLSYKAKSKKSYDEILSMWTKMGGKKSKFDDAITKGAKLRILKNKKKSGFDGDFPKNFSIILGDYDFTPTYSNFSQNDPDVNRAFHDYFTPSTRFSSADGDGDGFDDETFMPIETSESATVSEETVTPEDYAALSEEGVTETDSTEKTSAFKNFIAKILAIFRKNKADEVPYEEGTVDYANYATDYAQDLSYQPTTDSTGSEVLSDLDTEVKDKLEDPDATIDDIPKKIMGVDTKIIYSSVGALLGFGLGMFMGRNQKKSAIKLMYAGIGAAALGTVGYFVPKFVKKKTE